MIKISVIIPTYKRSDRLIIAIESVLKQTYPLEGIEIIVVDDNTENDKYRIATEKKLQQFITTHTVTYIKHAKNSGGCKARNTGAKAATGDYIAFLDDDDFYDPEKLRAQVNYLKTHPNLDACMCSMYREDENKTLITSRENTARGTILKTAILDGNLFTSMLLIKREVFMALDGFSNIPRFQDKYFHYKFLEAGYKIGVLDQPLLTLVEHSQIRISSTNKTNVINALDTLRAFELKKQSIFNKKENRFLEHRYHHDKAYYLHDGNIKQKAVALQHIFKSLKTYTGDYNMFKLALRTLISGVLKR